MLLSTVLALSTPVAPAAAALPVSETVIIDFSATPGPDGMLGTGDDVPISNVSLGGGELTGNEFESVGVVFSTPELQLNIGCGTFSGDPSNCLGADQFVADDFDGLLVADFTSNGNQATVATLTLDDVNNGSTTTLFDVNGAVITSIVGDVAYAGPTPVARFETRFVFSAFFSMEYSCVEEACETVLIDFGHTPGPDGELGTGDDVPITNTTLDGGELNGDEFEAVGIVFSTPELHLNIGCATGSGDPTNCLGADQFVNDDFDGLMVGEFTLNGAQATVETLVMDDVNDTSTTMLFDAGGNLITTIVGSVNYSGSTPVAKFETRFVFSAFDTIEYGCLVGCEIDADDAFRNAGSNPASYTSNAPVLGGTFNASVDLTTTGHALALVLGYQTPLSLTLGGGQVILVNVADPNGELLGFAVTAGPIANFSSAVPTGLSHCGFTLSTQAVHIGGVTPFALSNAKDLTVGK